MVGIFFFEKNFRNLKNEDSQTFSEIIDLFENIEITDNWTEPRKEEEETVRKFQVKQITLNVRAV